jgi:hypothetical protein
MCGVVATGTGTGLVIFGMGKAMTYKKRDKAHPKIQGPYF